jgi:hypothetical protein
MPTQDQVVQAGICVYDYVLNPAVRGEFNRVLAGAKASPDDGERILQSFFDRRQYATTPDAFKQVSSDYAKNPLTLSPKATRFAIDFAANSVLRLDWYDAARQMAATPHATNGAAAPAGAQSDPLAPLNDVLQRNGYTGVTADQATLAQTRLLTSSIGAWTGIYSQTTMVDQQGKSEVGPTLTIDSSKDPIQVTLDKKHIFGYTFDSDTNTLSWTKEGTGTFTNDSAAELNFSQYNGAPSFTGTHDSGDRSISYQGSTDPSRGAGNDSVKALAAAAPAEGLSTSDWISIASGIVGFASLVATAVGVHIARRAWGVAEKSPTEDAVAEQIKTLVGTLENLERSSQITPENFARLVSYAPVQKAISVAVALGNLQAGEIAGEEQEQQRQRQKQLEAELDADLERMRSRGNTVMEEELNAMLAEMAQ